MYFLPSACQLPPGGDFHALSRVSLEGLLVVYGPLELTDNVRKNEMYS